MYLNDVQPLQHADEMLMVTLPAEGIVVESDLVNTHEGLPASADDGARALYRMVQALGYPVREIVPIQGPPVTWTEFLARTGQAAPAIRVHRSPGPPDPRH